MRVAVAQDPRALVGVRVERHAGEVERREPLLERARLGAERGQHEVRRWVRRHGCDGSKPARSRPARRPYPSTVSAPDRAAPLRGQGPRCRRRVAGAGDGRRAARVRARSGRAGRRLPAHRRAPPDVRSAVVAVRPDADQLRPDGRGAAPRSTRSSATTPIDQLVDALPDGATVATVGWPELVGQALVRRGDVRVLAVDAGHQAFVVRAAPRAPRHRERAGADGGCGDRHGCRRPRARRGRGARRARICRRHRLGGARRRGRAGRDAGVGVAGAGRRLPAAMLDAIVERARPRRRPVVARESSSSRCRWSATVVGPGGRRAAVGRARRVRDGAGAAAHRHHVSVLSRHGQPTRPDHHDRRRGGAYLDEQRVLNVATIGPTGHPHLVAMWYAMVDGRPAFWTFGKSQKVVNLRRDPKITGLVESGDTLRRAARRRAGRHGAAASRTTTQSSRSA